MKARGLGTVYQRGNVWWIGYRWNNRQRCESSHSTDRRVAVKLLKKRHGEMGQGRLVGPDMERTTFEDLAKMLLDDYAVNERKSADRAQRAIAHLRHRRDPTTGEVVEMRFGGSRALDITADRVSAYIVARKAEGAMPGTIQKEIAALKRMFTLAYRAGRVPARPSFPAISVSNARQGFFEEHELRAILAELVAHLRPLVLFAYYTGWRPTEVRTLTWRQVDFKAGTVRLEPGTTKNREGRVFPFVALPSLANLLQQQREDTTALERERSCVIASVFHWNGRPIRSFHHAWRAACERAAAKARDPRLAGKLVHDLRRTAVRNLERAGVPRSQAMKLVGHKTESVYRRYAIVSEADLADGVRKLAALHGPSLTTERLRSAVAGAPGESEDPSNTL